MFYANMAEKRDGRVTIKDLSAEVISDLCPPKPNLQPPRGGGW